MAKVATKREISERAYEQLARMLARVVGGKIGNLEALDGFLTALAISPDLIKPSEFILIITAGETEDGDLVFVRPGKRSASTTSSFVIGTRSTRRTGAARSISPIFWRTTTEWCAEMIGPRAFLLQRIYASTRGRRSRTTRSGADPSSRYGPSLTNTPTIPSFARSRSPFRRRSGSS
jgi:hypothetical protein